MESNLLKLKKTIKGESKTDLESVISPLLFHDSFTYGAGIDAVTGATKGTAVKQFTPPKATNKSTREVFKFIEDESDFKQEIEASASGKYNIEGTTVNASTSFLQKLEYSEISVTLVADYESEYDSYDECSTYELTEEANKLKSDPARFRDLYGDYFIAGGKRISKFTSLFICKSKNSKSMSEFKASFGAETPDIFSAEGDSQFMQAAKAHNITINFFVSMVGYTGTCPFNAPWTTNKVIDALTWFKENELGKVEKVKLKHYSTIDNNYPTKIDIDPDVFVELSTLYLRSWNIKCKYASLPQVYRDKLMTDYDQLMSSLTANKSLLASDSEKRTKFSQNSSVLLDELNDILKRMVFYYKILSLIATEPSNGNEIEQKNGIRSWVYGMTTYPEGGSSVSISSENQNYSKDYKIGWRETTLEFDGGPSNKLMVGWEVRANRDDDNNGCWWKACNQILLKNYAAVHVKSEYDRGCNWTVIIYYVNASDYLFSV